MLAEAVGQPRLDGPDPESGNHLLPTGLGQTFPCQHQLGMQNHPISVMSDRRAVLINSLSSATTSEDGSEISPTSRWQALITRPACPVLRRSLTSSKKSALASRLPSTFHWRPSRTS